jgi:diacylglycerol kinase (ATP)
MGGDWRRSHSEVKQIVTRTLIILNPHAAGGRAGKIWNEIEPLLRENLGELVVATTQHPDEVPQYLDKMRGSDIRRVISVGGDGTNHALINALADFNKRYPDMPAMIYGSLPLGTGRDWARSRNTPLDLTSAVQWVASASPRPTDVGLVDMDGRHEHFLNIASVGVSGKVAERVNNAPARRPWTFIQATVQTLIDQPPPVMRILLDGELWYEGKTYIVAVANGTTFGHGMKIAPQARSDDGLFDVVLVQGVSRPHILSALWRVYLGNHLNSPYVHFGRAKAVEITSAAGVLSMELDGEPAAGKHLHFQVQPGMLAVLG